MFDIIINDIKRLLRSKNKNIISDVLVLFFVVLCLAINYDRIIRYGKYVFLFFFCIISCIGVYGMAILVTDADDELKDTKLLFTMPISIKTFICAKNILIFLIMLLEFIILEIVIMTTRIWIDINITKNLSFIAVLIFSLAFSNVYFFLDHRKFIAPIEGDLDSAFTSIKEGYITVLIMLFIFVVIFLFIKINISPIISLPISILFYAFSFKKLEKKLKYQAVFLEEVEGL